MGVHHLRRLLWAGRTHARRVVTLRAKGADSSKTRFHRQMISVAAAITIPVTNAVKQKNSSRSLRTTLMAASPCEPWSIPRAQRTPLLWRKSDLMELWDENSSNLPTRAIGFRPFDGEPASCEGDRKVLNAYGHLQTERAPRVSVSLARRVK
jgi:hypothetical protein